MNHLSCDCEDIYNGESVVLFLRSNGYKQHKLLIWNVINNSKSIGRNNLVKQSAHE